MEKLKTAIKMLKTLGEYSEKKGLHDITINLKKIVELVQEAADEAAEQV